jgi:hypothetical protein
VTAGFRSASMTRAASAPMPGSMCR